MELKDKIRVIEDFPIKGISFKDITTLLQDKDAFKYALDKMAEYYKDKNIDIVVGPEARGFLLGAPLAYAIGAGFVPVRKKGKLPFDTMSISYDLEYGSDALEIHKDAVKKGQRVAIIDDLLATGGTMDSVVKLIESTGGEVVSIGFLIELMDLKGRDKFKEYDVLSLVKYDV
ncbi:MAG: adenine phosphoribosyltransferase [Solirubrobacterales bacterium]